MRVASADYRLLLAGAVALAQVAIAPSAIAVERDAFRVCADPNNLPFSNSEGEGFENRLAEIWAEELGLSVEYTWFPQRRGFIRNTLRAEDPQTGQYKCDVVMGVVDGYELVITTKPYYRSTYVLVFPVGRGLDDVRSGKDFANLDDKRKSELTIGTFSPSPGADWLARHGMTEQMVALPVMSGDPAEYPGELVEKRLVAGEIDAAILWGPIGGFFAKQAEDVELTVIPLESEPGIQFDFAISAGVRFGEGEAKQELESLMDQTADEIHALLDEFHVPLLPEDG